MAGRSAAADIVRRLNRPTDVLFAAFLYDVLYVSVVDNRALHKKSGIPTAKRFNNLAQGCRVTRPPWEKNHGTNSTPKGL
jgi:hypothetical protein